MATLNKVKEELHALRTGRQASIKPNQQSQDPPSIEAIDFALLIIDEYEFLKAFINENNFWNEWYEFKDKCKV